MSKGERTTYADDDGRQIADMSGVTRPNLWSFRFPSSAPWNRNGGKPAAKGEQQAANAPAEGEEGAAPAAKPDPFRQISPKERGMFILAAVGTALGIAAVFGVVFAIAILIIGHTSC